MIDFYADAARPEVLIVAAPHHYAELEAIVQAAGGRAVKTGWSDIAGRPISGSEQLILVATQDVAADVLADGLVAIARQAGAADIPVAASLTEEQIDLVDAMLFGTRAELLCNPDDATLAAAIALGLARRGGLLADSVREREADRLRRLNEEVARIADVLARLTSATDRRPGTIAERTLDYRAPSAATPAVGAQDVRKAIRARRLRDQQFPGMLEDPAWDMLLDLYAADLEGAQVSVSSLCIAAAVPATTALRWIGRMTEAGLLSREPDPFDRRRAFMALSVEGRERMQRYFAALMQNGLHIA